jgi:ABC-type transporter Mla subunit MlaD
VGLAEQRDELGELLTAASREYQRIQGSLRALPGELEKARKLIESASRAEEALAFATETLDRAARAWDTQEEEDFDAACSDLKRLTSQLKEIFPT